ncbi:MAG: hypothetical protein II776_01845 [Clostridia bacterium]|nr:hypothetical protein [Clostridia bacterium]
MTYDLMIRTSFSLPESDLADISFAPWGDKAEPRSRFQGTYVPGRGFLFDLICYETEPLARFKKPGDPVYKDSCLELFCNFAPKLGDRYFNFEMNANGAYLVGFGAGRHDRVTPFISKKFTVRPAVMDSFWDVMLFVPEEMIEAAYGREIDFCDGYEMRANVYKCGEDVKIPHWLCWSPINTEKPDFHRPEQFGSFLLRK